MVYRSKCEKVNTCKIRVPIVTWPCSALILFLSIKNFKTCSKQGRINMHMRRNFIFICIWWETFISCMRDKYYKLKHSDQEKCLSNQKYYSTKHFNQRNFSYLHHPGIFFGGEGWLREIILKQKFSTVCKLLTKTYPRCIGYLWWWITNTKISKQLTVKYKFLPYMWFMSSHEKHNKNIMEISSIWWKKI